MPVPSRVSVGVFTVIPDERARVLLCHRTDFDLWNLPGGRLEAGEMPQAGVIREVREETGLTVEVQQLAGVYSNATRGDLVLVFRCCIAGGALTPSDETDRFAWLDSHTLPPNTAPRHVDRIRDTLAAYPETVLCVQNGPPSNLALGLVPSQSALVERAPTFRIGAFAVVRDETGHVLLGYRRDCDFWGLPGGGMEAGEAPWEAAVREVREETGLTVEIERLAGIYSWPDEREHIFSFTAHVSSGCLAASDETRDVRFFAPDALPAHTFTEHIERIRDALAGHAVPLVTMSRAVSAAIEKRRR